MPLGTQTSKIDGVFVLSKDWKCIKPTSLFKIAQPLTVRRLEQHRLQGCRSIDNKSNLFQVYLGQFNNFSTNLVIQSTSIYLQYQCILRKLVTAIEEAIFENHGSETKCSWQSKRTPRYDFSKKNGSYCIYPDDLHLIGNLMLGKLFQNSSGETEDYFLLFTDCGQSCKAVNFFPSFLTSFDLEKSFEVLLHVACDVQVSNHGVFWRRDKIVDTLQVDPGYSYYSGAIPGCGNFYFFFKELESSVRLLKFYSQQFKHVHREISKPFKESKICLFLMTNLYIREKKFEKNLENFQKDINLVQNLCKLENCAPYGRIEIIYSYVVNGNSSAEIDILKIFGSADGVFKKFVNSAHISTLENRILLQHYQKYLFPSLRTISEGLNLSSSNVNLNKGKICFCKIFSFI